MTAKEKKKAWLAAHREKVAKGLIKPNITAFPELLKPVIETDNRFILLINYSLTDLNRCPCCGRFHSFIPYQNIETKELLPPYVGECLVKTCLHSFTPAKYLKDLNTNIHTVPTLNDCNDEINP